MYSKELIEYVMKRAEFKASQIVRRTPALGEVEDVRQDLIADVLRRLPKFDGDRAGVKTFVCRVIDNRIADLLRARDAASRGHRRTHESLDDWVRDETGGWTRRGATLEESRRHAHLGREERDGHGQSELSMDTADASATLAPPEQTLCRKLQVQSPTRIARETGQSRSVLYQRIAAIRAVFIAAGLHHYL